MTDRELMQMALDALKDADQLLEDEGYSHALQQEAIKALRERLAQWDALDKMVAENERLGLYDSPPKREWVGLTDEEVEEIVVSDCNMEEYFSSAFKLSRQVEAKLKEKNT